MCSFDTIDHDWMVRMLAERIDDGALRRLMRKWLKAGVLDTEGQVLHPVTGTPQGGTVSPILAKVFLHDVLDLWLEKVVKQHCTGGACLMRYADDVVGACEDQADAERFDNVLGQRLEKGGLELSAAKTRMIPCSRYRAAGTTSFALLGCACRWGKDRKGKAHLGISLRRDSWVSVMYAEELNAGKSAVTLQRTDRHGILDQKLADFQESL